MATDAYKGFDKKDLILRDHLAIDRTILANENTLLAYVRTGLAIIASGASLLKFFDQIIAHVIGFLLLIGGVMILVVGYVRYQSMKKQIDAIRER